MRATIDTAALRTLAERAARAAAAKPYSPIYAAVLLDAEGDRITAYAADNGDTWLRDSAAAAVETGGRVAVSAKLLAGLAAVLPKGTVLLEDTGSSLAISRPGTKDRWTLPSLHAQDFPTWPPDPAGQVVAVRAQDMAHALDLVGGIVKNADAAIGGLRQIEITADGAGVTVRGTDRYRMAGITVTPEQPVAGSVAITVAPELAAVLVPMAREYDRVSILFPDGGGSAQGMVAISAGPVRVMTRLLDLHESEGARATTRRYLASAWPGYFVADRAELIGQLERAAWTDDALALELDGETLTITAQSDQESRDGIQSMPVEVPPDSALTDGLYAGVSARYLLDACKAYTGELVCVAVDKPAGVGAYAIADAAGESPVRYCIAGRKIPATARRAA